jgi:hypothetical protein
MIARTLVEMPRPITPTLKAISVPTFVSHLRERRASNSPPMGAHLTNH